MAERTIAEIIKQGRKTQGLSQVQLAKKVDLDPTFLSRVERGQARIGVKHAGKLAAALKEDPQVVAQAILQSTPKRDLQWATALPSSFSREIQKGAPDLVAMLFIPVVGEVGAGAVILSLDATGNPAAEVSEQIDVAPSIKAADPNVFAVKVRGDSFQPIFENGDKLIVSPKMTYLPNDLVMVVGKDNAAHIGRLGFEGDAVNLTAANKPSKTRFPRRDIKLIGRVVVRVLSGE